MMFERFSSLMYYVNTFLEEKNKRKQRIYLYSSLFGVEASTHDTQQHEEQKEKINAFDLPVEHTNKK